MSVCVWNYSTNSVEITQELGSTKALIWVRELDCTKETWNENKDNRGEIFEISCSVYIIYAYETNESIRN